LRAAVLLLNDVNLGELAALLSRYQLTLNLVAAETAIPGSFWGDEEAGLIANQLYARQDTPVHSVLHESCHFICMDQSRRSTLDTNAGGTTGEENAVCYLQILLANHLSFTDSKKMMQDMDTWGYSFRLGSTKAWFESDAEDARQWLRGYQLITNDDEINFTLRA